MSDFFILRKTFNCFSWKKLGQTCLNYGQVNSDVAIMSNAKYLFGSILGN